MSKYLTVENIVSDSGNSIANQFVLNDYENSKTVFQSYNSMIIEIDRLNKKVTVGEYYDYSTTTGKYRNIFFRDYAPETLEGLKDLKTLRKAIKDGFYGDYEIISL